MVGEIINRFRQQAASAYRRTVQQVGPIPAQEKSHSGAPGSGGPGPAQEVGGVPYAAAPTVPGADPDQAEFAVDPAYGAQAPAPGVPIEPAEPAAEPAKPAVEAAGASVPTEPDVPIEPAEPAVEPPVPDEPLEPLEPVEPPTPAEPDQPGEPLPPDPGLPEEPLVPTGAGEDFAADQPVQQR